MSVAADCLRALQLQSHRLGAAALGLQLRFELRGRLRARLERGNGLGVLALQRVQLRVALAERVQHLRDGGVARRQRIAQRPRFALIALRLAQRLLDSGARCLRGGVRLGQRPLHFTRPMLLDRQRRFRGRELGGQRIGARNRRRFASRAFSYSRLSASYSAFCLAMRSSTERTLSASDGRSTVGGRAKSDCAVWLATTAAPGSVAVWSRRTASSATSCVENHALENRQLVRPVEVQLVRLTLLQRHTAPLSLACQRVRYAERRLAKLLNLVAQTRRLFEFKISRQLHHLRLELLDALGRLFGRQQGVSGTAVAHPVLLHGARAFHHIAHRLDDACAA